MVEISPYWNYISSSKESEAATRYHFECLRAV